MDAGNIDLTGISSVYDLSANTVPRGVMVNVPLRAGRPGEESFWTTMASVEDIKRRNGYYVFAVQGEEMYVRQIRIENGQIQFIPVNLSLVP
jgi:hypothetical protein